jgi:hypothetical protein
MSTPASPIFLLLPQRTKRHAHESKANVITIFEKFSLGPNPVVHTGLTFKMNFKNPKKHL